MNQEGLALTPVRLECPIDRCECSASRTVSWGAYTLVLVNDAMNSHGAFVLGPRTLTPSTPRKAE